MIAFLKRPFLFLAFCLLLLSAGKAGAQFNRGTQMSFGKNRVQYNDFLWTYYRFKNFDTYFYLGGQELALYTGRTADNEIAELEKLFDYRINGRFEFIIYNRLSDLKQSNIGLTDDESAYNTGGMTRIIGNKVLIYFDGDYRNFRAQIRAGLAQVMINQLMFGGGIKDRLQSAVLLNLPDWYIQGLVSYIAYGWNTQYDDMMRDGILSGRYSHFNKLANAETMFAGHSLWNYIIETYGSTSVSNLLYMTRINRNAESGFLYVLGINTKELTQYWLAYYQRQYVEDDKDRLDPAGKALVKIRKPGRVVTQVKVSPDGSQIAYVTNDMGKYRIWVYDQRKNKKRRIAKGGYKSQQQVPDLTYPCLAWHPSGRNVTAIIEKKGKLWMNYYTLGRRTKKEVNKFFYFDKVLSLSYNSSGSEIALSAIQKGQSDIYIFNPRTKLYQQITKDHQDDLQPSFVLDDRYLIFASDRLSDSLQSSSYKAATMPARNKFNDIFLYDYSTKSDQLIRLTNTPTVQESQPSLLDAGHFTYLSDENGIVNRMVTTLDSTIAFVDTSIHYRYIVKPEPMSNYKRNLLAQDVNKSGTRIAELTRDKNTYQLYLQSAAIPDSNRIQLRKTAFRTRLDKTNAGLPVPEKKDKQAATITLPQSVSSFTEMPEKKESVDSNKIDISNYTFQSEFGSRKKKPLQAQYSDTLVVNATKEIKLPDPNKTAETSAVQMPASADSSYLVPKQRNYDIAFSADYLLTQLDNGMLNDAYQSYTGGAVYFDPGLNALIRFGLHDLFDDYKMSGGVRLAGDLNSNEYLLTFENLKHRLDKQIILFRQAREEITNDAYYKIHTHEGRYLVKWPFNDLTGLRGSISLRNDRRVNLSTDRQNLMAANKSENWSSGRIELVHDNTISTGLNLFNGLRYKLFAEYFSKIDQGGGYLGVLGADFRHYLKVHRQIIWANRFAASTTFGSNKLLYYLGSVDNSWTPSDNFNDNIQIDQSKDWAFQAVATNLRGFTQNIRNGNSFALINSELRVPLFQYLINKPIRSDFIRNFQVIAFGDIGTAWTGPSPYGKDNTIYKTTYNNNPITMVVTRNTDPIVGGYGFGLRSRVLGYFMRTDWAWGVDNGVVQPRIFYFSLGLDF